MCAGPRSRPSWRWRRRWPAASGPASGARCRSPPAASCGCAWTARWSTPPRSTPPWFRGPGTDGPERRALRAAARAPGAQRLRHVRRDRRPAGLRRRPSLDDFPFSAFVSKTITPEPRVGNPPPRIFETPAGMINSIGLPNKGLEGFLEQDLPRARRASGAAGRLGDGHQPRRVRAAWSRGSRRRARGRGARAERLLSQRRVGTDRRPAARGDPGAAPSRPPADREAADRQADSERRRAGDRGPGGGGRGAPTRSRWSTPCGLSRPTRARSTPGWARAAAGSPGRRSGRSPSLRSARSRPPSRSR